MCETTPAMHHPDRAVTEAGGMGLFYGNFCGDPEDGLVTAVRARQFPIVGEHRQVTAHSEGFERPPSVLKTNDLSGR